MKKVYIFALNIETIKAMSKSKQKKKYGSYNSVVINKLREKYGVTTQFIHQSLRGDRVSETSAKICSDYKIIETEVNKTLKSL